MGVVVLLWCIHTSLASPPLLESPLVALCGQTMPLVRSEKGVSTVEVMDEEERQMTNNKQEGIKEKEKKMGDSEEIKQRQRKTKNSPDW